MSEDYLRDGEGMSLPPPLPPAAPAPGAYPKPPKSPAAATLLSLFPGLGQVYNGQPAKAIVFFLVWVGAFMGADEQGMPFGLMIPFVWLYNMIDAWRSATAINLRGAGAARLEEDAAESPAWGGTLIALGLVLLARNLGWINFAAIARFWPVLLIVAGAALLRGSLQRRGNGGRAGL